MTISQSSATAGQQVTSRVGVHQSAAEGPAVPDLRIAHRLGGQRQQRGMLPDQRIVDHVVVRGHRPDHDGIAVITHPMQLTGLVDRREDEAANYRYRRS